MKQVKIVYVEVGKEPKVMHIDNTLEAMQKLVGGYLEEHNMGNGVLRMCNEFGKGLGLRDNGMGIVGNYFFTKVDAEGNSINISDTECAHIIAKINADRE